MNYVSKKQRGTALLVLFLIIVLTLTFFAVAYTKTIFSALAPANACPHFVNYSHPLFVCPPDVLSLRRVLRGNHTREYERLGGATAFHSQFWEDWFVYRVATRTSLSSWVATTAPAAPTRTSTIASWSGAACCWRPRRPTTR